MGIGIRNDEAQEIQTGNSNSEHVAIKRMRRDLARLQKRHIQSFSEFRDIYRFWPTVVEIKAKLISDTHCQTADDVRKEVPCLELSRCSPDDADSQASRV